MSVYNIQHAIGKCEVKTEKNFDTSTQNCVSTTLEMIFRTACTAETNSTTFPATDRSCSKEDQLISSAGLLSARKKYAKHTSTTNNLQTGSSEGKNALGLEKMEDSRGKIVRQSNNKKKIAAWLHLCYLGKALGMAALMLSRWTPKDATLLSRWRHRCTWKRMVDQIRSNTYDGRHHRAPIAEPLHIRESLSLSPPYFSKNAGPKSKNQKIQGIHVLTRSTVLRVSTWISWIF